MNDIKIYPSISSNDTVGIMCYENADYIVRMFYNKDEFQGLTIIRKYKDDYETRNEIKHVESNHKITYSHMMQFTIIDLLKDKNNSADDIISSILEKHGK